MPHKVNPIDLENSEGNLEMASALFDFFSRDLPDSLLQRDLSASTVERNFGVSLGHTPIGLKSAVKGLGKIEVNEKAVEEEMKRRSEVIAEAYQTILRREGLQKPYEQLAELTRGRAVTMDDFHKFVEGLDVGESIKTELKQITPTNYTGIARVLAEAKTFPKAAVRRAA